jgi:hypothetical protein
MSMKVSKRIQIKSPTAMLVLAMSLTLPLGLEACGRGDNGDEFREGVPYQQDVAMVVPGGSTQGGATQASALTAGEVTKVQAALLGETADLYKLTRDITVMVNGGTAGVLALVRTVTEFPPSSVGMDMAVWGPHTNPLARNTWRLTVNRMAKGQFQYVFDAKPRGTDDSAYLTILSGHHNVANPGARRRGNLPAFGSGDFEINWDNSRMLPDPEENFGKARFIYSRPSATSDVNIAVTFTKVKDKDTGMLIDAQYGYVATPGMGGNFQFTLTKDAILTTAALETLTVRSRWQETGAGRSDVKIVGGDVGLTDATVNECWSSGDHGFLSVFETNSYGDAAKIWGIETDCDPAFQVPDYAVF